MNDNYDYKRNARNQIAKYNTAKNYLTQVKKKLESAILELNKIKGIDSCVELKNMLNSRIESINSSISTINSNINNINTKASRLSQTKNGVNYVN